MCGSKLGCSVAVVQQKGCSTCKVLQVSSKKWDKLSTLDQISEYAGHSLAQNKKILIWTWLLCFSTGAVKSCCPDRLIRIYEATGLLSCNSMFCFVLINLGCVIICGFSSAQVLQDSFTVGRKPNWQQTQSLSMVGKKWPKIMCVAVIT